MCERRGTSTTPAGKQRPSVTVVPTLYFVGLGHGHSSELCSNNAIHEFVHDVRRSLGLPSH